MMRSTFAFVAVVCLAASPLRADPPAPANTTTVSAGLLDSIPITQPTTSPPKAMVLYLSDRSGWQPTDDAIVSALKAGGAVVLSVNFATYAEKLDKDDGDCADVVGDIVDAAQNAQRQLGIQTYLPPIVVGSGEAATLAYAALSTAPANTLGGVVGAGFTNRLSLAKPVCEATKPVKTVDGKAYSYGFDDKLPGTATLLVGKDFFKAIDKASDPSGDKVSVEELEIESIPSQVAHEVADLASVARPFGDLPAVDIPANTTPRALCILISGDGGWRDLDKTIGEWLATQGVHVVGLDALHYFWAKKTPAQLAKDIAFLADAADANDNLPLMLVGYSFGADTIPFAYPLLPKVLQDRTRVIGLLAPGPSTSFQITIGGWLGINDTGYDVTPAIAKLPPETVVCVYGEEDDDSACADRSVSKATIVKTTGGHHFDGDYVGIAKRFLDRVGPQ